MILIAVIAASGCHGEQPEQASAPFRIELLEAPAIPGSGESRLAVAADGSVILSWLEPMADGYALRFSVLTDAAWSEARTVARGGNWFVNWADFPSVVPIRRDLWAAHWLVRQPAGGYAYDVAVSLSTDGGHNWGGAFKPHTDGTATEHGFATLFPWQDGVGVVWLDGRQTLAGDEPDSHGPGGMTLRSAVVGLDGSLSHEFVIDDLTCDCCQTDVSIGSQGPLVVYRDRTVDEIRDIFLARAVDGAWLEPVRVGVDGWRIDGCPVNGPAIDAQDESVVVAWFTAAEERPRVELAWSDDGGRSFLRPVEVDAGAALGRVAVTLLANGDAAVGWLSSIEGGGAVSIRRVRPDGSLGPVRVAGRTTAARTAGFPQMVSSKGTIVLSWTEVDGKQTRIQSARVAADML